MQELDIWDWPQCEGIQLKILKVLKKMIFTYVLLILSICLVSVVHVKKAVIVCNVKIQGCLVSQEFYGFFC